MLPGAQPTHPELLKHSAALFKFLVRDSESASGQRAAVSLFGAMGASFDATTALYAEQIARDLSLNGQLVGALFLAADATPVEEFSLLQLQFVKYLGCRDEAAGTQAVQCLWNRFLTPGQKVPPALREKAQQLVCDLLTFQSAAPVPQPSSVAYPLTSPPSCPTSPLPSPLCSPALAFPFLQDALAAVRVTTLPVASVLRLIEDVLKDRRAHTPRELQGRADAIRQLDAVSAIFAQAEAVAVLSASELYADYSARLQLLECLHNLGDRLDSHLDREIPRVCRPFPQSFVTPSPPPRSLAVFSFPPRPG